MAEQEIDVTKQSVVVKMLADIASQGTYNNITVAGMRNMNTVFVLVADLINELEAEEKKLDAVTAILSDPDDVLFDGNEDTDNE